jgi:hypothetical protein
MRGGPPTGLEETTCQKRLCPHVAGTVLSFEAGERGVNRARRAEGYFFLEAFFFAFFFAFAMINTP